MEVVTMEYDRNFSLTFTLLLIDVKFHIIVLY